MKNDDIAKVDCPPDRIYFLDPSQLERSDLSALPIEDLISVQGDINRMLELMHEHSKIRIPEHFRAGILKIEK